MRDTDLMQLALGLIPPWMVKACAFDAEKRHRLSPGPVAAQPKPKVRKKLDTTSSGLSARGTACRGSSCRAGVPVRPPRLPGDS